MSERSSLRAIQERWSPWTHIWDAAWIVALAFADAPVWLIVFLALIVVASAAITGRLAFYQRRHIESLQNLNVANEHLIVALRQQVRRDI